MQTKLKKQQLNDQGAIALNAVNNILNRWHCSTEEKLILLGGLKKPTFYKYLKAATKPNISPDLLERLSYILNIHASLRILLSDNDSVYGWVRKPNHAPFFNGKSALDIMLQGRVVDLWNVSSRLSAERGGWA